MILLKCLVAYGTAVVTIPFLIGVSAIEGLCSKCLLQFSETPIKALLWCIGDFCE